MGEPYGDWRDYLLCVGVAILLGAKLPVRNPDGHSPGWWKRHPEAIRPLPPKETLPVTPASAFRGNAVIHFFDELLLWRFSQIGIPLLSGVIGATMVGIGHFDAAAGCFALSGAWGILSLARAPLLNFDTPSKRNGVRIAGGVVIFVVTSWLVITVLDAKPIPAMEEEKASLQPITLHSLMQGDMPTFNKTSQELSVGNGLLVDCMISSDFDSGAKFLSLFVPTYPKPLEAMLFLAEKAQDMANDVSMSSRIKYRAPDEPPQDSASLPFTGKVYIYHEDYLDHAQQGLVEAAFKQHKLEAVLRGPDYLRAKQEERRRLAHIPLSAQHTHANWLTPHQTTGFTLFPAYEGEVPQVGVGYRNAGDYPLEAPDSAVTIKLVRRQDIKTSFPRFYDGLQYQGPAGTLPSGTDDYTYTTYSGPKLGQDDAAQLNSGDVGLCAIGSLLWKDPTAEYDTTLYQCALEQADHRFAWNVLAENNKERKLGYFSIYVRVARAKTIALYDRVRLWIKRL
ncbi:MAG TPA: hypothetical protein VI386_21085 [Candidatus Sulfotelmatobacter sp.]